MTTLHCPDSVNGLHGHVDVHGRCLWCGHKIGAAMAMPRIVGTSELTDAYRQAYDPDWGIDE